MKKVEHTELYEKWEVGDGWAFWLAVLVATCTLIWLTGEVTNKVDDFINWTANLAVWIRS